MKRSAVAVMLFASMSMTVGRGASAAEVGTDPSSAVLTQDLAAVAAANGWDVKQALAYSRSEQTIGQIASILAEVRPDAFVGSALSLDPEGPPSIYVKGLADEFIRKLVASADIAIVLMDSQPFSAEELEVRKGRVHASLQHAGYFDIATGAEITDGGRIVTTVREQPSLATTADGVRRYLPADLRNDVTIHIQEEQVVHTQAIWGGMVAQSNQTWRCTGGFTITRSGTPSKGVATAGHCAGITHMLDPRNGNRTAVTLGDEYAGAWGDVEWYWSSVAENDDFFADTWDIRDVSSWEPASSISLNESICNFGWGGMVVHDCSAKVKDVSELCGIYGRMVVMDRIVTEVGDSGGPWFFNNRAFGIHSGTCLSGSHFSKVDHLDEALDVLVALS